MPTIVRENHDNMNASITLSIPVSDYQPAFKAKLSEYKKKAQMKGFRKGKVPFTVIRKMYGKSTLVEIINKMVGEELDTYLKAENLNLLGSPIPSEDQITYEFETKDLEDFNFKFDIGIAPAFEVTGLEDYTFNYHNAIIPDSMVQGDLEDARKQLGVQGSVEDEIQEEDVIKIQADELLAEGGIKADGFANEFSVSYNLLTEEGKAAFAGKKKGDLVSFDIFNLEAGKDDTFVRKYFLDVNEDAEDNPEIGNMFQGLITEVTRVIPAEMNQEFFDKYVGEGKVSSQEELMAELKGRIKTYYDRQADSFLFRDIKEHLEAAHKLEFPEAFLKRWAVASGNLPKDKTAADEELSTITNGLAWNLIRNKLATRFGITVNEAEIKQRLRMQLTQMFGVQYLGQVMDEYVDKMFKEEQQYNNAQAQVLSDKLFYKLKEVVTLNKVDITTEELEKLVKAENAKNQPPAPKPVTEEVVEEEGIEEAEIVEE